MINSSNSKSNNKNNDNKININTTVILVIIKIIRNNIYLEYWSSETDCIYSSIKEKKPAKASIIASSGWGMRWVITGMSWM